MASIGAGAEYSWLEVRWPDRVRIPLAVHCVVACGLQLFIAGQNVSGHALGITGAFSMLFWLVSAAVSSVAAAAVLTRRPWFPAPLLIAEVMIVLSACYVLWADYTSAYPDWWVVRLPAFVMLGVALPTIPPLASLLPRLPGNAWAGGLALLSGLGLTQFTVENYVIPNRSAPQIEVTASMEEVGRSDGISHVRGVVTIANKGKATTWIPQGYAKVEAANDGGGPVADLDAQAVADTFDPLVYDGRAYAGDLPPEAGSGTVWLEDLAVYRTTLPPGVSVRREFTLDVVLKDVRRLELRVDAVALTNAQGEAAMTCDPQRTGALSAQFLDEFRHPIVNEGFTFTCLVIPIASRNYVRELTADQPSVVLGYAFKAPLPESIGPFVYYSSVDEDLTDAQGLQRAGERFDRSTPSLVLTTVAALPFPLDAPAAGESG